MYGNDGKAREPEHGPMGAVIRSVRVGGPADGLGLAPGLLITSLGLEPVALHASMQYKTFFFSFANMPSIHRSF